MFIALTVNLLIAICSCSITEELHTFAEGTSEREFEEGKGEGVELSQVGLGHSGCCWVASAGSSHHHTTCHRRLGFHHFSDIMLPGTFVRPEYL
jgi:hypothetical protein